MKNLVGAVLAGVSEFIIFILIDGLFERTGLYTKINERLKKKIKCHKGFKLFLLLTIVAGALATELAIAALNAHLGRISITGLVIRSAAALILWEIFTVYRGR